MSKTDAPLTNVIAEKAMLGALLRSPHSYFSINGAVRADMFSVEIHKDIFTVLADIMESGATLSMPVLTSRLPEEFGDKQSVSTYLHVLASNADGESAIDFADQVVETASRRRLVAIGDAIIKAAKTGQKSSSNIASEAEAGILDLTHTTSSSQIQIIGEIAQETLKETAEAFKNERKIGILTGIKALDGMIGPLMPGDMVSILGASGHGKTTLATQILARAAYPSLDDYVGNKQGFMISQEMTSAQLVRRLLAGDSGVSTRAQRSGEVTQAEFERLDSSVRALYPLRIHIDGSGRQTMAQIKNKCRAMKRAHNIAIFAVDHAKLIKSSNPRWGEIETITDAAMEIKDLAKEIDAVGILLVQPTREAQKRETWRLTDQSIFGGDAIKQCSEIVVSVAIPEKWLRQREPDKEHKDERARWDKQMDAWQGGFAEVGVLKARDGDDGIYERIGFDGNRVCFHDLK